VAAHGALQEAAVLHQERIVEAHQLAELLDVFRARVGRQEDEGGIAGEVEDREDDEGDTEQDEPGLPEPAEEVLLHAAGRRRPGYAAPAPSRTSRATASMWGVWGN